MKIAVTEVIVVPDGTTHYTGWLLEEDDQSFYKQRPIAGHPVWMEWSPNRREWMAYGDNPPPFLKPVNDPPHSKVIE